ncbi:MAG: HEAT repeat domain-containing protein, partial [Pirellulales bacterium]|nr:HEAT repeat domain-containing protein [Pirellulales bacterium]
VETPTLSPAIRCAAAEALAGLRPARVDLLEKLLGQYGRHKQDNGSRYLPELHVELVRGLARHVSPSEEPLLIAALRNPSAEVRLEALSAWNTHREADVPVEVADLRSDPEPRVRAAVLPILGRSGRPQAEDHLVSALDDNDLRVRLAAVAALGELQSERAGARLEALLAHPSELVRAAAVASLTSMGNEKTVLGAAGDKSWRVRLAVAEALGRFSSRGAAASAITMLDDPSAPVQQQVVESIAEWPIAQSGPVLLEAMGRNVYVTRKAAAEQLARRWEPAGQFPVDGPPERRKAVLEQLQQQFRQQVGFAAPTAHSGPTPPAASTNAELAVRVEQLVEQLRDGTWPPDSHARAVADLQRLGPDVVGSIEHVALKQQKSLPDAVYREVLPPLSPAFAALDRMTSADVGERRRAAGELAELAAKQPLGRLATARLAELATAETDALVWQSMLTAVADDGGEPAVRLAAIAIGHAAPEVRRRACEHLAVHPAQGNAALLAPALEDRHDAVAAAAAAAMGQLGQVNDTGPLRRLLASAGETVRLEAAVSLARLGDDAGRAELERLSYSSDEKVRRRVATAMGEVPDRSFVPSLIRLLDDRHSTRVAALASLPKVVGHDVAGSPGDPRPRMTEHIEAWKRWHAEQPAGSKP